MRSMIPESLRKRGFAQSSMSGHNQWEALPTPAEYFAQTFMLPSGHLASATKRK